MDDAGRRAHIDALLDEALVALGDDIAPTGTPGAELLAPVAAIASKGKRMRALLLLTSYDACDGDEPGRAASAASALEMFQTAALIHDDVLDQSDTRRGLMSTHRAFESLHASQGWLGDAPRFGLNAAILAGDLALMSCQRAVVHAVAGLPAQVAEAVSERFTAMASLCTAGQYLDIRLASQPLSQVADQTEAIVATMRAKTASYTAEGPLSIGAALAGAGAGEVDAWAAVGVPLGIAFQLRDDVLGLTGAPQQTGKPAGDDLREGKRTLLLAYALERADAHGVATVMATVGNAAASEDSVAEAVSVVVGTGAVDLVETEIDRYAAAARDGIAALHLEPHLGRRLGALIDATVRRST